MLNDNVNKLHDQSSKGINKFSYRETRSTVPSEAMDHLPIPAGVTKYPFDIPVLCTENYDRLGFMTYPERKGFDISKLQAGNFTGADSLPQFLQTWLYFGLMSEVLSVEIDYKDFVSNGLLTTASLPQYLEEWKTRVDALDLEKRATERDRVYSMLVQSARIGRWLTPQKEQPSIPPEITLSMQVLVSTLQGAGSWIWQVDGSNVSRELNEWRNSGLIMWRMHSDGWCPSMLNQYFRKMNSATMAYICMLGKPDNSDHSACSWNDCRALNIKMHEYQTLHVTEGCDCPFLEVPQREVKHIVQKGDIPGLSLKNGAVVVQKAKDYVAISHVWKDGLGNVGHNSLPRCQLEMIAEKVEEVGCNTFWIDTICVPAERELKAAALSTMEDVYRYAQKVLVLDASLRKASCKNSLTETFIRVFICGWLTRLWTFQEGALAGPDHLRVVFADGIVSVDWKIIDDLLVSYRRAKCWEDARNILISDVPLSTLSMLRIHRDPELSDAFGFGEKFMSLWLGCRGRSVSNPDDEYIVFATMLGLDPGSLSLLDSDERMKGLLNMQEEWPHTMLFADGNRLRIPGYQWSPASLLGSWPGQPGNPAENAKLGVRTESGLVMRRPGYTLLETEVECMSKSFMCKDQSSGQWYTLEFKSDANPDDVPAWNELSPRKGVRTGLMIADRRAVDSSQWALLVTINGEEDETIYASFGCRLVIRLCSDPELVSWSEMLAPWARPDEEEANRRKLWPEKDCWETFGRIRECPREQMWCVG